MKRSVSFLSAAVVGVALILSSAVPAAAQGGKSITVPQGTSLMIRMNEGVSSKTRAGTRFSGRLEGDLVANGQVVAPSGSQVFGQVGASNQAGRLAGRSTLQITLTEIMINNQRVPIVTTSVSERGKSSTGRTARRAALGAGIGAIAGGGSGAGKGAAIGAGTNVLSRGETLSFPAGGLAGFRLSAPLTVNK